MLFNKKIEPCCSYCKSGSRISAEEVICIRKGVVSSGGYCRKFTYDPLKREPAKPVMLKAGNLSKEDFTL